MIKNTKMGLDDYGHVSRKRLQTFTNAYEVLIFNLNLQPGKSFFSISLNGCWISVYFILN